MLNVPSRRTSKRNLRGTDLPEKAQPPAVTCEDAVVSLACAGAIGEDLRVGGRREVRPARTLDASER